MDGRKYIGQKKFTRRLKRKPLKGKKRNRISYLDSDWQDYWGSNKKLLEDVEKLGKENFHREILYLAPSKAMLNYAELWHQVVSHSLLEPDRYYNEYVGGRISRKQLERFCSGREHGYNFATTNGGSLFSGRHQNPDVATPCLQTSPGVQVKGRQRG
jgi:hypothetical protein